MNKKASLWYTRQNGIIKGPFPVSVIKNNCVLNRLDATEDEISLDKENWQTIENAIKIKHDEKSVQQQKKRLDERNGFDRRFPQNDDAIVYQRRETERRSPETNEEVKQRQFHTLLMSKFRHRKQHIFWPLLLLFIVISSLSILSIIYSKPLPISQINCQTIGGPNVNWSNCLKPRSNLVSQDLRDSQLRNSQLVGSNMMNTNFSRADMAYSDLRFSNLSYSQLNNTLLQGANLKNADLSFSDLSHADLSYADLTNAILIESNLDNTRFDNAIWIDGETCLAGSLGRCIK
mgnify:CR=1 FL=1